MPSLGDRGDSELLGPQMTCEICDTATATMWVEEPVETFITLFSGLPIAIGMPKLIPSCDDCGPQLGYKILAPLQSVSEGS